MIRWLSIVKSIVFIKFHFTTAKISMWASFLTLLLTTSVFVQYSIAWNVVHLETSSNPQSSCRFTIEIFTVIVTDTTCKLPRHRHLYSPNSNTSWDHPPVVSGRSNNSAAWLFAVFIVSPMSESDTDKLPQCAPPCYEGWKTLFRTETLKTEVWVQGI